MPIFLEVETKKVVFVFQKNSREVWLHYYAHRGMPPQWPPSMLNIIETPKGEYLEFEDLTAYVQNKIQPPTDQIMCWIKNHLPNEAGKEKFNYKNVDYGTRLYGEHPITGCSECPKAIKVWPLKRFMCSHPGLKEKSFKWGFSEGKLTLIGFRDNGFPAWCPLPSGAGNISHTNPFPATVSQATQPTTGEAPVRTAIRRASP